MSFVTKKRPISRQIIQKMKGAAPQNHEKNKMMTFAYIKYYLYLCAQFAKNTFFINFKHIFYKLYIQLQQ